MQFFDYKIAENVLKNYPNFSDLNQGRIYSEMAFGKYIASQEDLFYTLYWSIFGEYFC